MPVVFENPGKIDLNAVALLGVSVKSDTAIGYFGTGLKFAIATLLRHNLRVDLFVGKQKVVFFTAPVEVRGVQFPQVLMQVEGESPTALGFTTQMGKDWELWMAYRELYCNALDEGGDVYLDNVYSTKDGLIAREENITRFIVYGAPFENVHSSRGEFILSSPILYADDQVEIRLGASSSIFYKGIKVGDAQGTTFFTYNILQTLALTEDRTLKNIYDARHRIAKTLCQCEDRTILTKALFTGENFIEGDLYFKGHQLSPAPFTKNSCISTNSSRTKPANCRPIFSTA